MWAVWFIRWINLYISAPMRALRCLALFGVSFTVLDGFFGYFW